jgi:hypothetical protein
MDTGEQPQAAAPQSSGADARPVLAIVEDTIGSLASLLLAADIAAFQHCRLHVAHVSAPRVWWGAAIAGMPVPSHLLAEADRAVADELRGKVADVLSLGAHVEWTFTWTRGMPHHTVSCMVSELSPIAIVVGAPHGPLFSSRRSLPRWLIGRPDVRVVVVPT